jgi:DNA-binding CsgD family transcriptional regulator
LSRSGTARPDFSKLGVEFGLTPREIETVGLLVEGLSSKEIAQVMGISPNTVKVFIKALMTKMQANGRTAIVSMAMDRVCTC